MIFRSKILQVDFHATGSISVHRLGITDDQWQDKLVLVSWPKIFSDQIPSEQCPQGSCGCSHRHSGAVCKALNTAKISRLLFLRQISNLSLSLSYTSMLILQLRHLISTMCTQCKGPSQLFESRLVSDWSQKLLL